MFIHEGRPTLDSGVCFLCELTPEDGYVDTLFNYEPTFFSTIWGRKFVCTSCATQIADLLGFVSKEKADKALESVKQELEDIKLAAHEARAALAFV